VDELRAWLRDVGEAWIHRLRDRADSRQHNGRETGRDRQVAELEAAVAAEMRRRIVANRGRSFAERGVQRYEIGPDGYLVKADESPT
jgi:hypothetical protein